MKINYLFIIVLFMASSDVLAESKDHGSHSHQEAHVHGTAELTLAMEGNTLEIEIESPSINIVGFEHKANTPNQHQAVAQAESVLKQPNQLFTFSGTRCEATNIVVDMTGILHTEEKEGDHHGHGEKDHDKHHDSAEYHDHHKEQEKHEEHHETHSEITANYRFNCDDGASLTAVSLELFAQFPGIEKINAMWVMEAQQAARTLTAEQNIIQMK